MFDGVGGETTKVLFERVNGRGRYVVHGMASGSWPSVDAGEAGARDITVVPLAAVGASPESNFELTEQAFALAVGGSIRPTIGQTFPLELAADAHAAVEQRRTIGKTLLVV